jgi:very-short-patch-repair endonuclease
MVADGILSVMTPGIYSFGPGAGWLSRAWAGVLLGGEGSVLGLETAAQLLGLRPRNPDLVTVFVGVQRAFRPGWRFIKAVRTPNGEPPRTGVEATVLDLCVNADEDGMLALLADAISARRTTSTRLISELAGRPNQRNRALLREILGDVSSGAHSALERRYLVEVERAHHLPQAARQQHAHRTHRSDGWYQEYRLLIELDSKLHHSGGAAFTDMDRDNDHALIGLTTLRFGWAQVTGIGACRTARTVAMYLAARGWHDELQPCTRCRLLPRGELIQIGYR